MRSNVIQWLPVQAGGCWKLTAGSFLTPPQEMSAAAILLMFIFHARGSSSETSLTWRELRCTHWFACGELGRKSLLVGGLRGGTTGHVDSALRLLQLRVGQPDESSLILQSISSIPEKKSKRSTLVPAIQEHFCFSGGISWSGYRFNTVLKSEATFFSSCA